MSASRLCFALLPLAISACTCLTEPGSGPPPQVQVAEPTPAPAPPPPAPPPPTPNPNAPQNGGVGDTIGASHILIAYKGSLRAAPTTTRSKEEAQKLANTVDAKAKAGAKFEDLAVKYSDDPTAKTGQGSLGKFGRTNMVKPFSDAAFALKPGEVSGVVETPFGFHIIKRTE